MTLTAEGNKEISTGCLDLCLYTLTFRAETVINVHENQTGTSKVGAISKAQKVQRFKNCRRGTLWAF